MGYSQVSSAQTPVCVGTASSALVSNLSFQVPSPQRCPTVLGTSVHQGSGVRWGMWGKSKDLSQPASAQAGACDQPYVLKRTRPLHLWYSFLWHLGKTSSSPQSLHAAKPRQLPPGPLMRVLLTSTKGRHTPQNSSPAPQLGSWAKQH